MGEITALAVLDDAVPRVVDNQDVVVRPGELTGQHAGEVGLQRLGSDLVVAQSIHFEGTGQVFEGRPHDLQIVFDVVEIPVGVSGVTRHTEQQGDAAGLVRGSRPGFDPARLTQRDRQLDLVLRGDRRDQQKTGRDNATHHLKRF